MNIPMPPPEVYLAEYRYMPWGGVIDRVVTEIVDYTAPHAQIVDLMCGPGLLAGRISEARPDLCIVGLDIDPAYVAYAQQHFTTASFSCTDVMTLQECGRYDVAICTGALHHLPFEDQPRFLDAVFCLLKPSGSFILAEPCIAPYRTETERQMAAAQLGYDYLLEVIRRGASSDVLRATCEILQRDILLDGEYKTYAEAIVHELRYHTNNIEVIQFWPHRPDGNPVYGDYIFICKKEV